MDDKSTTIIPNYTRIFKHICGVNVKIICHIICVTYPKQIIAPEINYIHRNMGHILKYHVYSEITIAVRPSRASLTWNCVIHGCKH